MSVNKKNSDGSYNQYASKPYVTKDNIGLSKVENKSSEDIRGEITSKNVTDALGYTPISEEELDKTSIPMIDVADGKSLATKEGFAKIADWDKNIGEYDITVCGSNLFDGTVKHGVYLHSETGSEFNGAANTSCTGFIPLMNNNVFIDTSSVYNFIYRYDKDQNFISPRQPISTRTFDDNVKYIRLASVESANFDDLIVSNSESSYEAYKSETFHITNDTLPFTIPTYSPVTNILAPSYVKTFIGKNEQGKYFVDMSDKADTTELNYVKTTIKGTAEGQFIYDSETKMAKVVPENVSKGIVAMIGGKTVKSKNILNIITTDGSSNGLKWKVNQDSSITLNTPNGATTAVTSVILIGGSGASFPTLFSGTNTLVWCAGNPTDLTGVTVKAANQEGSYANEAKPSLPFALIEGNISYIYIRVSSGKTLSNVTIYPMLVSGTTTEGTYEPYFDGLHNAPVEKISKTNIIKKPEFGMITKYTEITNRTGYIYEKLKSGKYHVSTTNAGTKAAFVGVFRNGSRIESTYKSINSGSSFEIDYDILNDDDIVIYQGSSVTGDFLPNTVVSVGKEAYTDTISLANLVKNLPDYGCSVGDIYNYVDFEEMVYHHRVIDIDGSEMIKKFTDVRKLDETSFFMKVLDRKTENDNCICNIYPTTPRSVGATDMPDKTIMTSPGREDNAVVIKDSSLATALAKYGKQYDVSKDEAVINLFNELEFVYELATEELIDISDILMPFMLESGGTITFENEYNLDVPNTVIYEKEMK